MNEITNETEVTSTKTRLKSVYCVCITCSSLPPRPVWNAHGMTAYLC